MSLIQNILNDTCNLDIFFSDPKFPTSVKYCGLEKEITENKKIYERNLPLDDINKNQILNPLFYNNSKYLFREQRDVFPPATEVLIEDKSLLDGNYPKKYLEQNFVNIDNESFLYNIDKPHSKIDQRNILTLISSDLIKTYNNVNSPNMSVFEPIKEDTLKIGPKSFNQETKRKNIIKDKLSKNQEWCNGYPIEYDSKNETKVPSPVYTDDTNYANLN
jgi:hypothetical protein